LYEGVKKAALTVYVLVKRPVLISSTRASFFFFVLLVENKAYNPMVSVMLECDGHELSVLSASDVAELRCSRWKKTLTSCRYEMIMNECTTVTHQALRYPHQHPGTEFNSPGAQSGLGAGVVHFRMVPTDTRRVPPSQP